MEALVAMAVVALMEAVAAMAMLALMEAVVAMEAAVTGVAGGDDFASSDAADVSNCSNDDADENEDKKR